MNKTSHVHRPSLVRELTLAIAVTAAVFSPAVLLTAARQTASPQRPDAAPPDAIAALTATPGVLGVEAARTAGGKQVIFVWFENKGAVLRWFYSDAHQAMMRAFAPGAASGRTPLADVPDDGRPILAIASLTMSDAAQVGGVRMPVSQIAIELYAPLPGGLAAGGRFAPAAVVVPGLLEAPPSPLSSR